MSSYYVVMELLTKEQIISRSEKFPELRCVVYFLIKNQEIMYVGETCNFANRIIATLEERARYGQYPDSVSIIEFDGDFDQRKSLEASYIETFNPPWNTHRGYKRHRTRPVITPDGTFDNVAMAAAHFKISRQAAHEKCSRQQGGWRFADQELITERPKLGRPRKRT